VLSVSKYATRYIADCRSRIDAGVSAIAERFTIDRRLLIGGDGVELEEFLASPAERFLA
jgi:hypothetical protein